MEDEKIIDWAMQATGVWPLRDKSINECSGGESQRVWIATVLTQQPEILFLDEPTTYLDIAHQMEMMRLIKRLNRESGITVVLITHHMREAALAQRVIAMSDGGIIADGTPKEVFRQVELLRSVGLNVPETTQLLYSLEQDGFRLPLDALSVEECAEALYAFLTSDR